MSYLCETHPIADHHKMETADFTIKEKKIIFQSFCCFGSKAHFTAPRQLHGTLNSQKGPRLGLKLGCHCLEIIIF